MSNEQEKKAVTTPEPNSLQGTAKKARKGTRSFTGPLSLIIAITALAVALYSGWQQKSQSDSGQSGSSATAKKLSDMQSELQARARDQLSLNKRIDEQQTALDKVPLRLQELDTALQAIPRPDEGDNGRRQWLLAETEYFLQVANVQMQLAANPVTAAAALQLADDRLRILGDPRLTSVRALIKSELAELATVPDIDVTGIALSLQTLAARVPELPLRADVPQNFGDNAVVPDEAATGTDRALASLRSALGQLIKVKQNDSSDIPQILDVQQQQLLVQSVDMELRMARLALVRGDSELFKSSLEEARQLLQRWFDPRSRAVIATMDNLAEMQTVEFATGVPDISGALIRFTALADIR